MSAVFGTGSLEERQSRAMAGWGVTSWGSYVTVGFRVWGDDRCDNAIVTVRKCTFVPSNASGESDTLTEISMTRRDWGFLSPNVSKAFRDFSGASTPFTYDGDAERINVERPADV